MLFLLLLIKQSLQVISISLLHSSLFFMPLSVFEKVFIPATVSFHTATKFLSVNQEKWSTAIYMTAVGAISASRDLFMIILNDYTG